MPKPTRSPVLGYNHNVKYRGRVFHVQTEDSGPGNPRIFTHLYYGGTILATRKHEYDPTAAEDVVRALMQSQHKSILKELKGGRHEERISKFFAARGETLEASPAAGTGEAAGTDADADAAPTAPHIPVVDTPPPVRLTFSETFDDEPTTPDQPPLEAPDHGMMARASPVPVAREESPSSSDLVSGSRRRPAPRVTPVMGAPVVVQRSVAIGGAPAAYASRPVARGRKPAPAIPYVVKEGTHPLAEAPLDTPPPIDLSAALAPTRPLSPPPVTPANAPLTSALPGRSLTPPEPAEKSLDEVILAYLAQGDGER